MLQLFFKYLSARCHRAVNGDSVKTFSLISKADNGLDSTVAHNFHTMS